MKKYIILLLFAFACNPDEEITPIDEVNPETLFGYWIWIDPDYGTYFTQFEVYTGEWDGKMTYNKNTDAPRFFLFLENSLMQFKIDGIVNPEFSYTIHDDDHISWGGGSEHDRIWERITKNEYDNTSLDIIEFIGWF